MQIGLFEGSDAAWDNADYHYTWEGGTIMFCTPFCYHAIVNKQQYFSSLKNDYVALRKDFELDATFKDFDLKIDIIKNDTR